MTYNNNQKKSVKAVDNRDGSFKGSVGVPQISAMPSAKITNLNPVAQKAQPTQPIKKGLGVSSITPIAAPQKPQTPPPTPPPPASD